MIPALCFFSFIYWKFNEMVMRMKKNSINVVYFRVKGDDMVISAYFILLTSFIPKLLVVSWFCLGLFEYWFMKFSITSSIIFGLVLISLFSCYVMIAIWSLINYRKRKQEFILCFKLRILKDESVIAAFADLEKRKQEILSLVIELRNGNKESFHKFNSRFMRIKND